MNSQNSSQATSTRPTSGQHQRKKSKPALKYNESLRSYIQRWSIIKNSAVDVSDKRAINAFTVGLRRVDLVKEMGHIKPQIVAELMDVANRLADEEDTCHNRRTPSPKDDRANRCSNQRRRSRNYDN
jgi:hypothetical protein